jgi:hypothetical protein
VLEDIAGEIIDRAYDADETLTESTKRFIDRHRDQERRPVPSVRPESSNRKPGRNCRWPACLILTWGIGLVPSFFDGITSLRAISGALSRQVPDRGRKRGIGASGSGEV